MSLESCNSMSWMVTQAERIPRRRPVAPRVGLIEKLVYDTLLFHGRLSCPQIAQILGLADPDYYQIVRNAIYRLREKAMVYDHARGRGPLSDRRVIWAAKLPH